MPTVDAAIAYAEERAKREERVIVVYHLPGYDRFGREGVFYVRPASDQRPLGAEKIYVAEPKKEKE